MPIITRHSLAAKLLRVIFTIYFSLTLVVTGVHVLLEYRHTKENVRQELISVQQTFAPALTTALWELNRDQLRSLAAGISQLPIIVGLEIIDHKGRQLERLGKTAQRQEHGGFFHQFKVEQVFEGEKFQLAEIRFYSDASVVIDRVKLGFLMIVFNALIKSTALFLLFLWAFKRYLFQPLARFINQVEKIDLESIHSHRLDLQLSQSNELQLMENTLNAMLDKITLQKEEVIEIERRHKARLEGEVAERTRELADSNRSLKEEILNRQSVENELRASAHQLYTEKERLAVTLQSIGDGVITSDTAGKVVLINRVAEELTGWSQDEAVAQPLPRVLDLVDGKSGSSCENPVHSILASGALINLSEGVDLRSKDGSRKPISWSGAPIRDLENTIMGAVLVFRDIALEKHLEEERLKTRNLESIGILAGGIAHDFNNILVAILGNINLAQSSSEKDSEQAGFLDTAEKASLRARDLTQQLLTFARGGEPVKKIASITEVISDSANFALRGSTVACEFAFSPDLMPVEVDTGQMSQVVHNLMINARHAMPEGGLIRVSCDNYREEHDHTALELGCTYVRIRVEDKGIGIPAHLLHRIFDPYFSTKHEGSGLGLAMCHSIIAKHHGHISVESEPGKGTTFIIYLPASSQRLPQITESSVDLTATGHGKILVMDDDEMVLEITDQMLTHLGYEVLLAKDGQEAIQLFQQARLSKSPVDLTIMDLTVPGRMGGKEAVRELLRIDPKTKVLVASGYSNDPVIANYKSYGFLGALAKPIKLPELAEMVKKTLATDNTSGDIQP